MLKTLETALARLRRSRENNEAAIASDAREMFVDMARAEIDGTEISEHMLNHWGALIDAEQLTEDEVRINVERAVKRFRDAALASKAPELKAEAERLEQAAYAFDLQSAAQHQANMEKLRVMQRDGDAKASQYCAALAAESDLLATGFVSDEEKQLSNAQCLLSEEISRLKLKLNENYRTGDGGLSAMIGVNPAALLRQIERELASAKAARADRDKIARLNEQRARALAEIARLENELAIAEKQFAAGQEKLAAFSAARATPEAFKIVRSRPKALAAAA